VSAAGRPVPIRPGGELGKGPVPHLLMLIVVAAVLLLALALTIHQVMDHNNDDAQILAACFAVIATTVLLLRPGSTVPRLPFPHEQLQRLVPESALRGTPRRRPPPPDEGTVLLR
jgi:hypothetical protein